MAKNEYSLRSRQMANFILAAIDGTNSSGEGYTAGGNRSFVRRFHDEVTLPSKDKKYWHGPEWILTGWDAYSIFTEVFDWIWKKMWMNPDAHIALVGHSRGGHIAVEVARRLRHFPHDHFKRGAFYRAMSNLEKFGDRIVPDLYGPGKKIEQWIDRKLHRGVPVRYLGLYDAVDMTSALGDTSVIPKNVAYCYHAIRDPEVGSRAPWGNTGMSAEHSAHTTFLKQTFAATHGALGGAVPEGCGEKFFWGSLESGVSGVCHLELTKEANQASGEQAYDFILGGATRAGLPVLGRRGRSETR